MKEPWSLRVLYAILIGLALWMVLSPLFLGSGEVDQSDWNVDARRTR